MLQQHGTRPARSEGRENADTRFVAVVAPKGGVGKTTISMSLLVSAARAGYRVRGVDMDGQRSFKGWSDRRSENVRAHPGAGVPEIPVDRLDLGSWRDLSRYVNAYDLVLVDTPPGLGDALVSLRSLCNVADLVLIPSSSSGMDLDKVAPFGAQFDQAKAVFVLNRVNRRTKSMTFARNELLSVGRLCPVYVQALDRIPNQFLKGLAATDLEGEAGSEDFEALWHFVRQELRLPAMAPREGLGHLGGVMA